MANFELKKKTVMLRITGPSAVIERKEGYKRVVKTGETFVHFLEDVCKLKVRHMMGDLHVMAVSNTGRKDRLPLTATIKDFIQLNYKGPARCGYYCVKVIKTRKLRRPSKFSGRYSSTRYHGRGRLGHRHRDVEVVDLDVDVVDQIPIQGEGDEDVNRDLEEEAEEETLRIVTTPSTKPSKASKEANGNKGIEKNISTPRSSSMDNRPSTSSSTPPSSGRENSSGRKSEMGQGPAQERKEPVKVKVKTEKKCERRNEQWESFDTESMLDLEAEGIDASKDLRPIVKRNLRTMGNSTLLRVREEMRFLRAARRQNIAFWDKITDRAPYMAHFMARMFAE